MVALTRPADTPALHKLLRRLCRHLSSRRRRQAGLLILGMLLSAASEVISLGAVLPFLSILVAPDLVMRQPIVASAARAMGYTTADQLLLPLTLVFIGAALVTG